MIALADVIDRFGADYRRRYGHTLTPERAQALSAMQHCRRRMAPQLLVACPDCAEQRLIPHSCGHRLCPHCQHFESERWLERQRQLRVPTEYFLLTFTLPGELRPLAFRRAEAVYTALFACAWISSPVAPTFPFSVCRSFMFMSAMPATVHAAMAEESDFSFAASISMSRQSARTLK